MLMNCPECELQVSDKAISCPHCGYPLQNKAIKQPRKTNKRKRLPNGFGQITEIKGQALRKTFRAMVTVGKNSKGRPICKLLKPQAYFETYNEAYAALLEYNKNPYDLDDKITMIELYEKWSEEYFKTLKNSSSIRTITSAWAYYNSIYDMRVCDVRARHIKGCMKYGNVNNKTPSVNTKTRMKSLMNLMFDYAVEYELTDKNYARTFNLSDENVKDCDSTKNAHISFTDEEMNTLWENINKTPYVDMILYQCYSGWRPQELGLLKLENIDWDKNIIVGGSKTDAGTNRSVPIHPLFKNFIKQKYLEALDLNSEFLFNCVDATSHKSSCKFTYDRYRHRFDKVCKQLNINCDHRPHDPRKHFVTMAKKYNVDEYAIKYIVGHAVNDITEEVYTDRNTEWLNEEIKKIKGPVNITNDMYESTCMNTVGIM